MNKHGRRGRPLGFRLSEESKRSISASKIGQKHKKETRDKISRSLLYFFKKLNPLSEEITNMYCRMSDDYVCGWITGVSEELDSSENILTLKAIRNTRKVEIACGDNIELFSHNLNPEMIYLLMEDCETDGINPKEFSAIIGDTAWAVKEAEDDKSEI